MMLTKVFFSLLALPVLSVVAENWGCQGGNGPFRDSRGHKCAWYGRQGDMNRCNKSWKFEGGDGLASAVCCACTEGGGGGGDRNDKPRPTPPSNNGPHPAPPAPTPANNDGLCPWCRDTNRTFRDQLGRGCEFYDTHEKCVTAWQFINHQNFQSAAGNCCMCMGCPPHGVLGVQSEDVETSVAEEE